MAEQEVSRLRWAGRGALTAAAVLVALVALSASPLGGLLGPSDGATASPSPSATPGPLPADAAMCTAAAELATARDLAGQAEASALRGDQVTARRLAYEANRHTDVASGELQAIAPLAISKGATWQALDAAATHAGRAANALLPPYTGTGDATAQELAEVDRQLRGAAVALPARCLVALTPPTPSPTPSPTPFPVPSLSGVVPPVTTGTWTALQVAPLTNGPLGVGSVVAWASGYLALTPVRPASPFVWVSRDGRTWAPLASDMFGGLDEAGAAPIGDGLMVATNTGDATTVWLSQDGLHWTPRRDVPALLLEPYGASVAGSASGAIAIGAGGQSLVGSRDGVAWSPLALPGAAGATFGAVAAFGSGFVAVGYAKDGENVRPLAWRSADGLTWTAATVAKTTEGDGFVAVHPGRSGLIGITGTIGMVPGITRYWTSADGSRWAPSSANPLGVLVGGEGEGSVNGLFSGDGTRLLVSGNRTAGSPWEYWVSFDGRSWSRLSLSGDLPTSGSSFFPPSLMRDGLLFVGEGGAWFGAAVP